MDAQAFWNVIGNYNEQTAIAQIILLAAVAIALALSYTNKVKWAAKAENRSNNSPLHREEK